MIEGTVVHVVRRFGPVGGMETYVWNLVHGLVRRGQKVSVVCEEIFGEPEAGIQFLKVEKSREKPRWRSMKLFRLRVDALIREKFAAQPILIHSHERSLSHQVSTFHGPPIDAGSSGWWSRFNRRLNAWKAMEREELLGKNVAVVLSVSSQVQRDLCKRYPQIMNKVLDLAWPGTSGDLQGSCVSCVEPNNGKKFLFVGKEWKRKGLDHAVEIVKEYRKQEPKASLAVFGVDRRDLPKAIKKLAWVSIHGWSDDITWGDFDLLLHPAKKEPFAMVVAEARSHGLPVLMSSRVGAADLDFLCTKVVDIDAPLAAWTHAAADLFSLDVRLKEIKWSWNDLIRQHVDKIYPQVELWIP